MTGSGRPTVFMAPRSVAVIGASESSGWTRTLLRGWESAERPPRIYLVNPRGSAVHGRRAYRNFVELPELVDMAYVLVGPTQLLGVVRDCLSHGIRDFVLLSHVDGHAGLDVEVALRRLARDHDARILGPNVSGFVSLATKVTLFGLPRPAHLRQGHTSFAMQSGGLATHALSLVSQWNVGLASLITTGNEAGVTLSEVVDWLVDDPETWVIALFVESIRDPAAFRRAIARAAAAGKPVVALMVGSSKLGRSSALAHTGALVGDFVRTQAALEGMGIVTVTSLEELVITAGLMAHLGTDISGNRVGVIAASGGACELIADLAERHGLDLAPFPPRAGAELEELVPGGGHVQNPLDLTGVVVKDSTIPLRALRALAESDEDAYDLVLFQSIVLPGVEEIEESSVRDRFIALGELAEQSRTPVVFQTAATHAIPAPVATFLARCGILVLPGIATGLPALQAVVRSARLRSQAVITPRSSGESAPTEFTSVDALARESGLAQPPTRIVSAPDLAGEAADDIGYPVVVKVESPDIAHKSDVGGVALNLRSRADVEQAVEHMAKDVAARAPGAVVEGFRVAAMREEGLELLASVVVDDVWGPLLTLGAGGIFTEILNDAVVRPLPVTPRQVAQMLAELRISRRFAGYRGSPAVEVEAVVQSVLSVVKLACRLGDRALAVEVNPLCVFGSRVEALDLLVEWSVE